MKQITINLYSFDELSEEAKEKAIDNALYIYVDYDWWNGVYYDAKQVGVKISSFDIDRGSYCEISIMGSCEDTARAILDQHGEACDTYKIASQFLEEYTPVHDRAQDLDNDTSSNFSEWSEYWDKVNDLEREFINDLSSCYLSLLRAEYEYLTSREAIEEILIANDYQFTEDGNLY